MKLFFFEFKKLLSRRYLKFIIVLLLFINAFNIYENYDLFVTPELTLFGDEYGSYEHMRYEMQRSYFGEITQEKVNALAAHIEKAKKAQVETSNAPWNRGFFRVPGADRRAGEALMEELERLYTYDERIVSPLLEKNREFEETETSAYAARLAGRIKRIYSERRITEYYRVNEYRPILEYKLSSLLALLICVYTASGLFAGEREAKMYALQKSTLLGVKRLFFIKLAVLAVFTAVLALVFYAEDFAVFSVCRRPSGLHMPLWSVNDIWGNYEYSPLGISVGGFLVLLWPVRSIGLFTASLFTVLLSVLLRRTIAAFLSSLPCTAVLMALTMFTDGVFSYLRWFEPVTLLIYPRLAENFIVKNVADLPVFAHEIAPVGCALLLTALVALSFALYKRRDANA